SSHLQACDGPDAPSICSRSPTAPGRGEDPKHRGTDRSRCGRGRFRRFVDFQSPVSKRDRHDTDDISIWKTESNQRPVMRIAGLRAGTRRRAWSTPNLIAPSEVSLWDENK